MLSRRYFRIRTWKRAIRMASIWRRLPDWMQERSLKEILQDLDPSPDDPAFGENIPLEIRDMAHFLLYRLNLPLKNTCLIRSMALYHCLRAEGTHARIIFAIRPGKSIDDGHAWVEIDGEAFMEADERRRNFVEIFTHPERGED